MKRVIATPAAPRAVGPYSQAVVAGTTVYVSGQIALTPEGTLIKGSIADETRQIMQNLQAVLAAAGADFGDVAKATIYLTDISDFQEVNTAYSTFFDAPYPARECVGINRLPLGARIEISLIATL